MGDEMTADTAHTSSPWHLTISAFGATVWAGDDKAPKIIADKGCSPTDIADARLIAAAPDLLALAQSIRVEADRIVVGSITNPMSIFEWESVRRAATVKATGEIGCE